ncbi:putative uncharacterized protein encoded by MAPKAPK5-AS1 [Prionailurus viverrinus]|uniref:putative uncharacterized protein encoded by MAPKAPK5-AS1 n=1 Tax=Prionailurus viverrinus TaxID=61388 RepID=UPI001FF37616|nr:putative uncharacterized protein encoded by MAPKAPK5-AS1 [Prionailurus viverrinus]
MADKKGVGKERRLHSRHQGSDPCCARLSTSPSANDFLNGAVAPMSGGYASDASAPGARKEGRPPPRAGARRDQGGGAGRGRAAPRRAARVGGGAAAPPRRRRPRLLPRGRVGASAAALTTRGERLAWKRRWPSRPTRGATLSASALPGRCARVP